MIPKECKRLAEVDFPIAVVSKHSAREKSIRHGHPSTLHLWWARRPLAACRSVLIALLLPDPCDPHCPEDFKKRARATLQGFFGAQEGDAGLQRSLLTFVGDLANWEVANHRRWIGVARELVSAAYPDESPLVVDPFAGGGSIPLEALRLGCDAFASDLNPIACLINKVLLLEIPRNGPELVDEVRRVGDEVKGTAARELADYYSAGAESERPIAFLWARTVRCEAPQCGAEIPLMRSFWLCKKPERRRALKMKVIQSTKDVPRVEFEIFVPSTEKEVRGGTVSRAKATCVCCGSVLHPDRVREQLAAQRGGADVVFDDRGSRVGGARLLSVVTLQEGQTGRQYRLPTDADYAAVWHAQKKLKLVSAAKRSDGLSPIPDEPLPPVGTLGFRVQRYGMLQWGDLFTARQKLGLHCLSQALHRCKGVADTVVLALGKQLDLANALCPWEAKAECPRNVMSNGRVKPSWDFAEGVIISDSSGSFETCLDNLCAGLLSVGSLPGSGSVQLEQAQSSHLPTESVQVVFTDPPYYDAIPYSDLADFFLVWFKRTLPGHPLLRDPFDPSNPLSPKVPEAVQDETKKVDGRPKDREFFEDTMALAFAECRRVLSEDGIGSVVFAHKTTEGWEALLSGMMRGGWTITGSWPLATEMGHRLRARESAALATSIHLVCRPRPENSPVGDWGHVLRELPRRVADWMERLQSEGVRGADLVFACIGPALEVYSRYSKVVDAEEREIPLGGDPEAKEPYKRGFLAYVWEVVGRAALDQVLGTSESEARNGGAGALEEDARLTALFLWTLQATTQEAASDDLSSAESDEDNESDDVDEDEAPVSAKKKKGLSLPFDVARRFAQPLGIHLDAWEGRCIETEKGIVRLVPVMERAQQLFGEEGAQSVADQLESVKSGSVQLQLFIDQEEAATPRIRGRRRKGQNEAAEPTLEASRGATTLDRVHAAMLLQASGRSNALRALLKSEIERAPDFLRLANSLSALYPPGSDEKRLVDAMLLAVPR